MPTEFKVTVPLNIPRELLWRIRASRALSSFLVSNGALNRLDRSATKAHPSSPTARTRRQVYVPANLAIPDIIKGLFDDSYIEVIDDQVWDDATQPFAQRSVIRSGVLADVITTTLTLSLEPDRANKLPLAPTRASRASLGSPASVRDTRARAQDGAGVEQEEEQEEEEARCGCLHTLAGSCSVGIPFLGYYVEQAVVANMRDFYDAYPRHFEQFLDMVVGKYGDGTRDSLAAAIDALLAEEQEAAS